MNVPKKLIGSMVEITWKDPNFWKGPIKEMSKGRAALVTWKEYGVILDVTDGVTLLAHSTTIVENDQDISEVARTALPEEVIENIIVFKPLMPEPERLDTLPQVRPG